MSARGIERGRGLRPAARRRRCMPTCGWARSRARWSRPRSGPTRSTGPANCACCRSGWCGLRGADAAPASTARRGRVLRTQSAERVQDNLDHLGTLALGEHRRTGSGRRAAWPGKRLPRRWRHGPDAAGAGRHRRACRGPAGGRRGADRCTRSLGRAPGAAHRQPLRAPAHACRSGWPRTRCWRRCCRQRHRAIAWRRPWTQFEAALLELEQRAPEFTRDPRRTGSRPRRMATAGAGRARRRQRRGPRGAGALQRGAGRQPSKRLTAHVRAQPAGHHVLTPAVLATGRQAATFSTCAWRV